MKGVGRMLLALALARGGVHAANSWNTFSAPPKSINISAAPAIEMYAVTTGASASVALEDAHAVVGCPNTASHGGHFVAGKAMECGDACTGGQDASKTDAFASSVKADGTLEWTWRSNAAGKSDAANGIIRIATNDIIVAGWETVGGVAKRSITKLSGSTGTKIWTFTDFGDAAGSHGAIELATQQTVGGETYVMLSGFIEKPDSNEMSFKSYGNAAGGKAWVACFPEAILTKANAPTLSDIRWTYTNPNYMSAKAAYATPAGDVAVLMWSETAGKTAGLVLLDGRLASTAATSTAKWGPIDFEGKDSSGADKHYVEGTDLAFSADGAMIAISGHGGYLDDGLHYSGKVVRVNAATGALLGMTEITSGGTRALIYNECWGVTATAGGFVVACGTGIENCNAPRATAACTEGRGDPAHPTLLFKAGQWLSMVAKVGSDGELLWQRADGHRDSEAAVYAGPPSAFTATVSSASEWVSETAPGVFACVQDETNGFGIMTLKPAPPPAPAATNPPSTTTPAPAPKVSFTSGLGGITKAEFEKAAVLAAYKDKLATEINKQSASAAHAHRRRLSNVAVGDIEIKNIAANPNGGVTFKIEINVAEAAKSAVYNKVDSFAHKLEESAYATTFKSTLKVALKAAGATVDDSQFDAFAIGTATAHPTSSWAGDSKSDNKVNIGAILGGICGPLFGILGYLGWKNEQKKKNKNKTSNVAPTNAVAEAEASAKI